MRVCRNLLLSLLLAAFAWPVHALPLCGNSGPVASCCCPSGADGDDGCGPGGCCCVREGAPAEPQLPEPRTAVAAGHHEILPLPVPLAISLPPAAPESDLGAARPAHGAGDGPSRFVVLCTFRC